MHRRSTDNLFRLPQWRWLLSSDSGLPSGGSTTTSATPGVNPGDNTVVAGSTTGTATGQIDWGQFNAGLANLGNNLAEKLDLLRGDVTQLPNALRPEPVAPPPPNYDEMTQAELAAHITGNVMRAFESKIAEMLNPLASQINDVRQTVATGSVTADVKQMQAAAPDFNDWKDEMVGLAKQHPTLGIKQLYNLAKAENSEKAATLNTKYNPPAPPPPKWGGLTPSALSGTNGAKPVTREQASTDAYREVAARHPGVLAALESM